jgi:cytoskeletal protein CcmA (bactofilin family)
MFESKKNKAFTNDHSLLSPSTRIIGDLYFSGELYLDGTIKGNIYSEEGKNAKLIVTENSYVEGEIHVPNIVINGRVRGSIYSTVHIELAAKAIVEGAIHYKLIEMMKGSHLIGQLICGDAGLEGELMLENKPIPILQSSEVKREPSDVK